MKYIVLNLLLFIGISLNAQITINFGDYPVIGDIHKYDSTNIGGLTAGAAGANITWDFSNISGNYNFSRNFIAPSASTYSAAFPGANMVIQDAEAETFLDVNATKVEMLGIVMDIGLGAWTVVPFTNTLTSINFPTDYTDSFSDTYDFDITVDGSSLGADSVNVTSTASVLSTIDAYGKLITPNDTVECLREYVEHTSTTVVNAYVAILGSWTQIQSTTSTDYSYTWVAMGHGSGVMEVTTNSLGNIETIKLKEVPNTVTNV
ncbi:MAG TPA: hypothetical protein EYQ86_02320, partial [Bacteroidetes bacterium]|nr:hypothetical protein [Bacteroidota bacterium]